MTVQLRPKEQGGPSGVDANGFKRILACKSFKHSSIALCEALATLTRTVCTEYVHPSSLEAPVEAVLSLWIKVKALLDPLEWGKWYGESLVNA